MSLGSNNFKSSYEGAIRPPQPPVFFCPWQKNGDKLGLSAPLNPRYRGSAPMTPLTL